MAIDRRLLDLLCCPLNRKPLRLATAAEIRQLQEAAGRGELVYAQQRNPASAPAEALLEPASGRFYPVLDEIPVLLPEEAITVVSQGAYPTSPSLANSPAS